MTKRIYLFRKIDGEFIINVNDAPNYNSANSLEILIRRAHKEICMCNSVLVEVDKGSYFDIHWVRDYEIFFNLPKDYPTWAFTELDAYQQNRVLSRLIDRKVSIPSGSPFKLNK